MTTTGSLRILGRFSAFLGLLVAATACAHVGSQLGSPLLADIGERIDESVLAEAEGRLEDAIGVARNASTDPKVQSFPVMKEAALQRLGLALTRAGQLDEAEAVAREMDTLDTNVRGMPVRAAIAFAKCDFVEAANLQLRMRAASLEGVNDRPTEANLAAIDEAEGRFLRAIERLNHVASTPPHPRSNRETNALLATEVPLAIARIRSRLGEDSKLAELATKPNRPDPMLVASRYAEHALKNRSNLLQAYHMMVDGLLVAQSRNTAPESLEPSRQQLKKLVAAYKETPSPCRKVIPDPTFMEFPAKRAYLFPWLDQKPDPNSAAATSEAERKRAIGYLAGREVHLNHQLPFDYNSDQIKEEGVPILNWLAEFANKHPELGTIYIEGHTDDQGTDQYNLDLSNRRAKAVVGALVVRGVPDARLVARGYGKSQPKVAGTDDASRAVNRRVEILVSWIELQETAAASPVPSTQETQAQPAAIDPANASAPAATTTTENSKQ